MMPFEASEHSLWVSKYSCRWRAVMERAPGPMEVKSENRACMGTTESRRLIETDVSFEVGPYGILFLPLLLYQLWVLESVSSLFLTSTAACVEWRIKHIFHDYRKEGLVRPWLFCIYIIYLFIYSLIYCLLFLILPLVCLVWQEAEAYWLFSVALRLGWPADATGGWEVRKGRPMLGSALWLSGTPQWLFCHIPCSHSTAPLSAASSHSLQPMASLRRLLFPGWRWTPVWLIWGISYSGSPHLCPHTPKSPVSFLLSQFSVFLSIYSPWLDCCIICPKHKTWCYLYSLNWNYDGYV